MLLQKKTDTRGVGISRMRKSIYLLTTTITSHTHRFHPLPLATPIHFTHTPQLSSILLTCAKFKVWMTIVESGWNLWVWLVCLVSRRWVWLVGVGGIYGCDYSGCGCKEVYRKSYALAHVYFNSSTCTNACRRVASWGGAAPYFV